MRRSTRDLRCDDQSRCTAGTSSDGIFDTEITYADRNSTARDSLGHTTTYHYNDLLQVAQETDPLGHTIVTDPIGTPLELATPEGRLTWHLN